MDKLSYSDRYIRDILASTRSVAIVGASVNPSSPSFFVVKYLLSKGYDVFPVNPVQADKEIEGIKCHVALADVPGTIDMVDIFRNSEAALGVVEEALRLDPLPKVIWMQLGIHNEEAAAMAEAKGISVIMDRCPKIEYARLCGEIGWVGVNSGVISSKRPKLQKGYQRFGV